MKNLNTPGKQLFYLIASMIFLKYVPYSCEKSACPTAPALCIFLIFRQALIQLIQIDIDASVAIDGDLLHNAFQRGI